MSQAIRTKYMSPSNHKPARIQAKCEFKTIYISYDSEFEDDENHKVARNKLIVEMKWNPEGWVSSTFQGDEYHVPTHSQRSAYSST